jgi:hypothetical protein
MFIVSLPVAGTSLEVLLADAEAGEGFVVTAAQPYTFLYPYSEAIRVRSISGSDVAWRLTEGFWA